MISGIGIDIIEVARFKDKQPNFFDHIFTNKEIEYCEGKRYKAQFYAARFAAKEAFLKALGTGLRHGISWKDIEIVNDSAGRPFLKLEGKAKQLATENDISNIQVSLSHIKETAVAVVILESFKNQDR